MSQLSIVILLCCFISSISPADAQNWTEITPVEGEMPIPRRNAAMIYDPVDHQVIVFSGRSASGDLNDVWSLDLNTNQWTEITPAEGEAPAPRWTANGVYDPANHQMIIWSGQGTTFFNDVWAFDLTTETWSEFTPAGGQPNIRYGTAAVFDPINQNLVTFAGFTDQGRFGDTWQFDVENSVWTELFPPGNNPAPRCLHSASYDSLEHRMIMYGGTNGNPFDDIWAFDFDESTWSEFTPAEKPTGRFYPTNIYDAQNHQTIVFGGKLSNGSSTNQTWAFDLNNQAWQELMVSDELPSKRNSAAAVYVESENRMVVFGGLGDALLNDVWSLNRLSGTESTVIWVDSMRFDGAVNIEKTISIADIISESTNIDSVTFQGDGIAFSINNDSLSLLSDSAGVYTFNGFAWHADSVQSTSPNYTFTVTDTMNVGLAGKDEISQSTHLLDQNYPNPFTSSTQISYTMIAPNEVKLAIYDMLGREIQVLVDAIQQAGFHSIQFDADKLSSGVYFYTLQIGSDFVETKSMFLMR